jgi:hypothetical protein
MHRSLRYAFLFGDHQDLNLRLFKNSLNHMRHWDKNAGVLVKLGSVIRIENAMREADGREISTSPMPVLYAGEDRLAALQTLLPHEEKLIAQYEKLISLLAPGEVRDQLSFQLGVKREHLFTQTSLLANARRVKGLH